MTVKELLMAMAAAYRGFDEAAVDAMAPVFRQKLEKYEGKELANAWIEVAASFDAKPSKPYPLCADFEKVLPQPNRIKGGPALDKEAHARRKNDLVIDWRREQMPQVAREYGARVAFWAESEVRTRAGDLAWKGEDAPSTIRLSDGDLKRVLESVASRDRMDAYGAQILGRTDSFDAWQEQMGHCRGHVLAGRYSIEETPQAARQAKPKRSGPVVDVEAVEIGEPPAWLNDGPPQPEEVPE